MSEPEPTVPGAGPDFVEASPPSSSEFETGVASRPADVPAEPSPMTPTFPWPQQPPATLPAPGITPPAYADSASASHPVGETGAPGQPDVEWWKDQAPVERVGRGILFSLGAIVIGVALTMIIYKLGFMASITSFVLAYSAVWLYTLGAGAAPRKGVWGVLAVIVVGIALSVVSLLVTDVLDYLATNFPDAALADKLDTIWYNLGRGEVWGDYTADIVMYLLFAGLGTFGVVRQLGRARKAA